MKFTELQIEFIKKFADTVRSFDQEVDEYAETWSYLVVETPVEKGVFVSLLNAGVIYIRETDIIGFTKLGWEAYKSNFEDEISK